ncbi:MAG: methyltransferase domain-containing protein [Alphaproteobacteria bacterium]|nr:methyltransferase domain-containing protein [Alphaproteobacteria bacterium]
MKKLSPAAVLFMTALSACAASQDEHLLTHDNLRQDFDLSVYQKNLERKPNLTFSLDVEMDLLKELGEFDLGRFLLKNKGLNGYWTAYIILHGPLEINLTPLETWFLHKAPTVRATQERFGIFKQQLSKYLKSEIILASVPCGLMDDLLGLDYAQCEDVKLVGIDLDGESLQFAQKNAQAHGINAVEFIKRDAWNLGVNAEYDVLTSNGLNIYQPNDEKVVALYGEFYKALKAGGIFITSFLTPPPVLSAESPWNNYDPSDVLKQKAIFGDIIQVGWQAFRSESKTRDQLAQAGFTVLDVLYDSQGMFPTVVARK